MKYLLPSDCPKDGIAKKESSFSCSDTLNASQSQDSSCCNSTSSASTSSSGTVKRKLTRKANFACIPKHEYAYLFDAVYLNNSIRMRENSDQSSKIAVDAVNERFFNGELAIRDVSKHYLCPHFTHDNTTPCFISERFSALKEHLLTHKDSYYYCYSCETKFYNKNKALIHFDTVCSHLPNRDNGLVAYLVIDLQQETIENFKKHNPLKYQVLSKDEFHMASLASKKSYGFQLPYNNDGTIDTSNLHEYVTNAVVSGNERKRAKLKKTKKSSGTEISLSSTKKETVAGVAQKPKLDTTRKPTKKVVDPEATRRLLGCTERIVNNPNFLPSLKDKKLLNPKISCYVRSDRNKTRPSLPIPQLFEKYNISSNNNFNQSNTRMPFPVYQVTNNPLFMQDLMKGHFEARKRFLSNISSRPIPGPIAFPYADSQRHLMNPSNQAQVMSQPMYPSGHPPVMNPPMYFNGQPPVLNPPIYSNIAQSHNTLPKQVYRPDTSKLDALATVCTVVKELEDHKNSKK